MGLESLAPIVGGAFSAYGQHLANESNERIARENRAFQERMSSTSYQRAVEDLKLAGINPMLAISRGGASSPSGSTAQMGNVASRLASSAVEAVQIKKQLQLLQAQIDKTEAETSRTNAEVANISAGTAEYITGLDMSKLSFRARADMQRWVNLQITEQILRQQRQLQEYSLPAAKLTGSTFGGAVKLGVPAISSLLSPLRFLRSSGGLNIQPTTFIKVPGRQY